MRSRSSWKAPVSYPDSLASSKRINEKRTKFLHGSAIRARKSALSQNDTNEHSIVALRRNSAARRLIMNCGEENGLKKNRGRGARHHNARGPTQAKGQEQRPSDVPAWAR